LCSGTEPGKPFSGLCTHSFGLEIGVLSSSMTIAPLSSKTINNVRDWAGLVSSVTYTVQPPNTYITKPHISSMFMYVFVVR